MYYANSDKQYKHVLALYFLILLFPTGIIC